ncbi:MAG TPA: DUF481 domain-containing protein [Cellvibrio sp.]|nr:DUF481 domain-containing protein [Cellvibrio sp.]
MRTLLSFKSSCSVALLGVSFLSASSFADTLLLTNGDRISGEIQALNDTSLTIKTDYNPSISITLNAISSFSTEKYLDWKIRQTQNHVKIEQSNQSHNVLINNELVPINTLSLANTLAEPKWRKSGNLETSIEFEDKKNQKHKIHINGDIILESDVWRHKLKSELKREKEAKVRTEDNAELRYALDYLLNDEWLLRSESFYREDNLGDMNKYTYLALGPGYRVWGEGRDKLDIITTYNHFWITNKAYAIELNAWAATIDYKQLWLDGKVETFSDMQIAFPDLEGLDSITNINLGLRYLLTQRVYLSLKYEFNETKSLLGSDRETSTILGAGVNF